MSRDVINAVARREFRIFSEIGDSMQLSHDDRRRALALSEREWADWSRVLADGPLPQAPMLPEMLRRLGQASWSMAVAAEQRGIAA